MEQKTENNSHDYLRAVSLQEELAQLKRQERILDAYLSDENKNVYLYEGEELVLQRITVPLFREEIEALVAENLRIFIKKRQAEKCVYRGEYFIRIYNHHFRTEQEQITAIKVEFVKYPKALADISFWEGDTGNYHMEEEAREELALYAATSLPVVLSAYDEILKRKAFAEVIRQSAYRDSTPFYIRFGTYSERETRKLFEDENSVLNLRGHVMILDGLERLDGKERLRLREYLLDSRILALNKLIIVVQKKEILEEILSAIPYHYVSLNSYFRQRNKEEIIRKNLEEFAVPVTEENVQKLLRGKFLTEMDLKRVLADGRYQREKEEREEATYLEKKNLEYVMQVLQEENGNQSRAAKRLGIGRTTLWRMLKK